MSLVFWTSLAIILLVFEAFILLLIPGAILFFAVRGMRTLNRKVPEWMSVVQSYAYQACEITHKVSEKVAAPLMTADSTGARLRGMKNATVYLVRKREV